ncbi:choice-of-anchor I family protein [Deinococcus sp. RM]|uniref:choice-of-anchor I family protein n=1 Tax=Deinococcus sp. RM TaxID=2316359 RepID=UPI0026AB452A
MTTLDFTAFDAQRDALKAQGLRDGKSQKVSLDAEPEYITVSTDSKVAWVTLQESNAIATVDLTTGKVTAIKPMGFKDYSKAGAGLDASDRDGGVNIKTWPVLGAYMPDAIASVQVNGQTYLLTANEGDTRDYTGFGDEVKVADLTLDAAKFPTGADLKLEKNLGRLVVSKLDHDTDGDGDADRLVAFGGRSLSIWKADGTLLADTGDLFEQTTSGLSSFNSNGTRETFDTRSDNKGPEPEGVTTGVIGARTFAFVGLERTGGVMVLDVTDPAKPALVQYSNDIKATETAKSGLAGDLAPEGLLFIPAADSPNGKALLVTANEVSGSTTISAVADDGKLSLLGRHQVTPFAYDKGAAEIPAFDKLSKRLFVVNGAAGGLSVLDVQDPAKPVALPDIPLAAYGKAANSVTVHGGVLAVAVEAITKTDAGKVALLDKDGKELAKPVTVGALPDMLTFSPDGKLLLVAGEGEPNADYSVDPLGTVSVINVAKALANN